MTDNTELTVDIAKEIDSLVANWGMSPEDINHGYCAEFADCIEQRVPGAESIDLGIDSEFGGHVFIYYKNLYYDAQNPNGVHDFRSLLFFANREKSSPLHQMSP